MEEGLVIGSELHGCCVYNKQCRSKQCFICWKYGHLSTICPSKEHQVCGKCSGEHHHGDCTSAAKKCATCGGYHEAWNKVCVHKKKEIARTRQERVYTPHRFETSSNQSARYQTSATSASSYFMNAINSDVYPKPSATRGGPMGRGRARGGTRGGYATPDLNRTVTPRLRAPDSRAASTSPTRSTRNRSPTKATQEAEETEEAIRRDVIDPDARIPLTQRNSNNNTGWTAVHARNGKRLIAMEGKENVGIHPSNPDQMDCDEIADSQRDTIC